MRKGVGGPHLGAPQRACDPALHLKSSVHTAEDEEDREGGPVAHRESEDHISLPLKSAIYTDALPSRRRDLSEQRWPGRVIDGRDGGAALGP